MNPRIQVEHTVTEEVTDVDLVQSQMRIAAGETLADLGLTQDTIQLRGAALQCRITTEDPANGFRPDTGKITTYRSPGGAGVRLDGGTTYTGAEVSAHFDSMLAKLTCRGRTFEKAVERARRAVAEFRIRGVSTNIAVPPGGARRPGLPRRRRHHLVHRDPPAAADRPHVRRPRHQAAALPRRRHRQPAVRRRAGRRSTRPPSCRRLDLVGRPPPDGTRQLLLRRRARGVRPRDCAPRTGSAVTDTTFRDAHQSLLATRVRTRDLVAVAGHVARTTPQLWSLEAWGGATYDVALRFLAEDPWERLAALREAVPNICLQMLLRGRNTVGYTPYPTEVTDAFVEEAAATGIDVFRIFDALNDVEQMRPAIEAVRATGTTVAEVALCYTGDLSDPGEKLYTLDYYLRLAERIVDAGAHVLAIKDMAGLLRAPAARHPGDRAAREFDLPVHLHTHDTPGGQLATLLAAIDAGVDAVDAATAVDGRHHLAAVAVRAGRRRPTTPTARPGWPWRRSARWSRTGRRPDGSTRRSSRACPRRPAGSTPTRSPAASSPTCASRRSRSGLGEKFEQIEDMYAAANAILGNVVKVTPSSKVVGDLALHLVAVGADPAEFAENPGAFDIPDSVIGFLTASSATRPAAGPSRSAPRRSPAAPGSRPWPS